MDKVDPYLVLAIQATILTVLAWITVAALHKFDLGSLTQGKSALYIGGAGVIMMVAYMFYFTALEKGKSSAVQPLDRLSLVFAIGIASLVLKEKLNWASYLGGALMAERFSSIRMLRSGRVAGNDVPRCRKERKLTLRHTERVI